MMKRTVTPLALLTLCCASPLLLQAAEAPAENPPFTAATTTVPARPGTTLEEFYSAALNYNPSLSIAREMWNINTARKQQANGDLLPQISAVVNRSDNRRETNVDPTSNFTGERFAIQLRQVLFDWEIFSARGQAYLQEDMAEAEYYAELASVLTDIADRYLVVLQAEDALRSLQSEQEAMENQVNQIQRLYDLQQAKITDLYEGQARIAAIRANLINAESDLTLAREALRASSGLEVGDIGRLPETITVPPLEGQLDVWLTRARENNRVLEARTLALQSANKFIAERRAAHMPQVSLVMLQQETNIGFENSPLGNDVETRYIGIDLVMPLFSGGKASAGVREAQSMRNIAEGELRQAQLEVVEQTRTAWLQVRAGESRIEAGRILAESTATSYEAMQRGFELGQVTSVDVLNSLRDQFQAQRDLQQARYDHLRSHLQLRRHAGVLTPEDILETSQILNAR